MNILFVAQEICTKENIVDFFKEIDLSVDCIEFKKYFSLLEKIDFFKYDFIFIELLGSEKTKIKYIKKFQSLNLPFFIHTIFVFDNINSQSIQKHIRIFSFDYLLKPIESKDILEKIDHYKEEKTKFSYDDCKMILKGKLLRPLEHQWKQPLNVIATNLLNLELKSELSKLTQDDVSFANEKVETALNKIATNISSLNQCFKCSEVKSEFYIDDIYNVIIEFVSHQVQKYNIDLRKKENMKNLKISSFENEFSLSLFIFLYVLVQTVIEKYNDEMKYEIEFFCEENEDKTEVYICFNDFLSIYEVINKYTFEFFVIKELSKKIKFDCTSFYENDNTFIKLTF